jgi:pimeloyl-ACP methyl ester carboxylesterase
VTDPTGMVGAAGGAAQADEFAALQPLARRLGVRFEDASPPRHLTLPGAGGVRLHALDWGGEGPPALFLHGGRLTARTWDYVCLGLRGQVRAVALDLRGHGDSAWTNDYAFESYIADIGPVLDALGWPRAHLIGMSLGGFAAAHYAGGSPHRIASLTTVDVGPGVVFEATARMRGFFQTIQASAGPDAIVEAAMQISSLRDRERLAYRMAAMMRRDAAGNWRWAYDDRRRVDYPALLAKIEATAIAVETVTAPCLVVRGGRSQVFSDEAAARFAARFANGAWTTVPDAGHNVQEDNPTGLIAALQRFWSRGAG